MVATSDLELYEAPKINRSSEGRGYELLKHVLVTLVVCV